MLKLIKQYCIPPLSSKKTFKTQLHYPENIASPPFNSFGKHCNHMVPTISWKTLLSPCPSSSQLISNLVKNNALPISKKTLLLPSVLSENIATSLHFLRKHCTFPSFSQKTLQLPLIFSENIATPLHSLRKHCNFPPFSHKTLQLPTANCSSTKVTTQNKNRSSQFERKTTFVKPKFIFLLKQMSVSVDDSLCIFWRSSKGLGCI